MCRYLQTGEYVPYNINGGKKKLLKQILHAETQKSKSGKPDFPGGLQRLSHLPTDYVRKVFIYFRFGSLNNWNSGEVGAWIGQTATAQPTAAVFLSRKAHLLAGAVFACHGPPFCSPCYQEFIMINDADTALRKKHSFSLLLRKAADCNTLLAAQCKASFLSASAFLARFCQNK